MDAAMLHYEDPQVGIGRVVVGPMDNNVFVVRCSRTGEAVLVDAADEPALLLGMAQRSGVRRVLTTHGHRDHIRAVPAMRHAGYPVGVAAADAHCLPGHDFVLEDGSVLEVGDLRLEVIATPGHSPGSTCFLVRGSPVLLAGDTLFPGGPGKTRGNGGDFATILRSIEERLLTLPDDTVVMPGHGADTTIGTERPHFHEWVERGW